MKLFCNKKHATNAKKMFESFMFIIHGFCPWFITTYESRDLNNSMAIGFESTHTYTPPGPPGQTMDSPEPKSSDFSWGFFLTGKSFADRCFVSLVCLLHWAESYIFSEKNCSFETLSVVYVEAFQFSDSQCLFSESLIFTTFLLSCFSWFYHPPFEIHPTPPQV